MELDYTTSGQHAGPPNIVGEAIPPSPKKAQALLWSFSCSEECASSPLACEQFSQHHIWYWRSGGK